MNESVKVNEEISEADPDKIGITFKSKNTNIFDKLDEYTLENIFILSENAEFAKISIKMFRVAHHTSTQVKYLKRNIYSSVPFLQSIFYSRNLKLAKKEELAIALINHGVNINTGGKSSIFYRAFRYGMNSALNIMLRMYKIEKLVYTPGTETPNKPDIFKNNEYYVIKPMLIETSLMELILEFELYKDEKIRTFISLFQIWKIKLDLVEDCGITEEDLFLKEKRKITLYRNMNVSINFDLLIKTAILNDQPKFIKYVLEYKEYSASKLQELLNLVVSNHEIFSTNKAYSWVESHIADLGKKRISI
ncbi:hypothetical protein BB559_001954 [Furculomyces boomerangus]|uniref:Uncharacterized protein n=1 Tax=Furculomyces boomerangus TaxID=61424 RepID=A0A2T9YZA1_9FUNG|nr:hypothetical protein BB559_001954 [Furculomyces boomerangus]